MELRPRKGRNWSVSVSASKLPPPLSATPSAAPPPLAKVPQSEVSLRARKKAPRRSHVSTYEEDHCVEQPECAPGTTKGDGALAKDQEKDERMPHDDAVTPPSGVTKSRALQRTSRKAGNRVTPAIAHNLTMVAATEMDDEVIQSAAKSTGTEGRRRSSSKKTSRRRDVTKQKLSDKVQNVSSDSECGRIQDNVVSPSMYTVATVYDQMHTVSNLEGLKETEASMKQAPQIVSEVDVELSRTMHRNLNKEFSASLEQLSDASLQEVAFEDLEHPNHDNLLVVALEQPGLSDSHGENGEPFASGKKQAISVEAVVNLQQIVKVEDQRKNTKEICSDEDAKGCSGDVDNEDEDEDEDEEEAAKAFISCMKAHLLPNFRKSMPQGKSQEESISRKAKAVIKESQGMASNHCRLAGLGLSWSPQTGLTPAKCSGASSSSHKSSKEGTDTFWKKEQKLQDGLLMPPLDPSKLNKLAKMHKDKSAGGKWYNLSAPTITPELKKDLQLLKLRRVVDPKRHYKADDSKGLPKHFQVGTVVGGAADFYSGRLTKKEQKSSLADELLADSAVSAYRKRKYVEIQKQQQAGGKAYFKKKKSKRIPSWARI